MPHTIKVETHRARQRMHPGESLHADVRAFEPFFEEDWPTPTRNNRSGGGWRCRDEDSSVLLARKTHSFLSCWDFIFYSSQTGSAFIEILKINGAVPYDAGRILNRGVSEMYARWRLQCRCLWGPTVCLVISKNTEMNKIVYLIKWIPLFP